MCLLWSKKRYTWSPGHFESKIRYRLKSDKVRVLVYNLRNDTWFAPFVGEETIYAVLDDTRGLVELSRYA